ncbi:MAG: ATP-binding protein [Planctomycetota bacterium]
MPGWLTGGVAAIRISHGLRAPVGASNMPIDRDVYIDYLARCQQAFRPFAPIDLPRFFQGRQAHVDNLRSELAKPGRQVAIYGERGVGKTSLAQLAYFFAKFDDEKTYFVRCGHESNYETIFGQVLMQAGLAYLPNGTESESKSSGALKVGPFSALKAQAIRARHQAIDAARSVGPATLLRVLEHRQGLVILDEYDRVRDQSTHVKLAETLKHFSDAAAETKIIVVGTAETLAELIGEHQSLTRCLAQIKLDRMTHDELAEIIRTGEEHIGVAFKEGIRKRIVDLADGFPFYVHLLCNYCAEEAGKVLDETPAASVVVSEVEYRKALRKAIDTAESTLRESYLAAVITLKRKTEMYKCILWGLAYAEPLEVQVRDLADNIGLLTGEKPKIASLNNYLGPLTKAEKRHVLARVRQGYYKFTNPLMRAYVRLILDEFNIMEMDGQMQFPWMRGVKSSSA